MKSIAEIHDLAPTVELVDALHELVREEEVRVGTEKKPGGAYTRWAKQASSKSSQYETQTARLHAVRLVIATMSQKEFKNRLFAATQPQTALF
ncbi:MAG: hypothetical protein AAB316_15230 [Bacteroidota bacterium]